MNLDPLFVDAVFIEDPFETPANGRPSASDKLAKKLDLVFENYVEAFSNIPELLKVVTPLQIAKSLHNMFDPNKTNLRFVLEDDSLSHQQRAGVVDLIANVFSEVFEVHTEPSLGHLSERSNEFSFFCYMFWDVVELTVFLDEFWPNSKAVMAKQLKSSNIAVIESGLHGLGHAHLKHPDAMEEVDHFLRRNPNQRAELIRYAEAARCGMIQ